MTSPEIKSSETDSSGRSVLEPATGTTIEAIESQLGKDPNIDAATGGTGVGEGEMADERRDKSQTPVNELEKAETNTPPYSHFTTWQKRFIVMAASCGSLLSPLTTNIYFPALNTIAHDLDVSVSKINLSITTYMIFQGLAPTFVGGFSDSAGRRPAYMVGFVVYTAANIGLALQNNYAALMVLRCLQSAGSSGMVALASGVTADIVTSAERGAYIGYASVSTIIGPSISPILGGVLAQYLGWHSIFWFLTIFGGCTFLMFLAFFPETCRKVVGDGSVPPPPYNQSVMTYWNEQKMTKAGHAPDYTKRDELAMQRRVHFPNPLSTLRIVADKEAALILVYSSLVYAGYYAVTATISTQFKIIYGYNDSVLGLMFIPISVGGIAATVTNGKWDPVDRNYARHARKLGMLVKKNKQQDLSNFPIERARLEVVIPLLYAACVLILIYGWLLDAEVSVAGPLVILPFIGFTVSAMFKVMSILLIDIAPGRPATATAAFNLVRCLFGAGLTAAISPMINTMGRGGAFTFISLVLIVFSPMLFAVVKWGPQLRRERAAKDAARKERHNAKRERKHQEKHHGAQTTG